MSRWHLNIDYSLEQMAGNRKRMEADARFEYFDRVPVGLILVPRFFTPIIGMAYGDLFKDVETQYEVLLEFAKYRIENIPEDVFCQGPTIYIGPYFDNVVNSDAMGAEIVWPVDETPQSQPTISSVEEMERFVAPEPTAGLWGKLADWWLAMKELAAKTEVYFDGHKGKVEMMPLSIGAEGPHMMAVDLVGSDFYWWMLEYPQQCHQFMQKITEAMIGAERHCRQVDPRPRGGMYGIGEDSAQIMSPALFREFCVPYDHMLYEAFGKGLHDGRGMHMCGCSEHLHEALVDDLGISSFNYFGYVEPSERIAERMGGKLYLRGNISPMLMLNGSREDVKTAARECLEALAPCGGFLLADGANVCPGTPVENLGALTEAAEEYGLPETCRS